jgi:hypothetical protein
MVVEDSFAYLACRLRFYVINVARPREPVLVGSCVLSGTGRNIALGDTVAFVAMGSGGLACINVSNPAVPSIIGTWGGRSGGVALADTIAYVAGPYTSLVSLDVADPTAPRVIDSLWLTDTLWWNDVAVNGSLAYVGGERVLTVDISDPVNLRVRGTLVPPYLVQRLFYAAPYIYAACYEAGVCVLETVQVGMSEELSRARLVERPGRVCPNPAYQFAAVRAGPDLESAVMRDVLGRLVRTFKPSGAVFTMDLTGLGAGLYFIELRYNTGKRIEKLIKR